MNLVTASQKAQPHIQEYAKGVAKDLGLTFVPRKGQSLPNLMRTYESDYILIITDKGPFIYFGEKEEHHFHLSMAQLRLLRLDRGQADYLVNALKIPHGEVQSILDCTMGLGSDSIIMAYGVPQATVVGLEMVLPLWYVTTYGLSHFEHERQAVTDALRRIEPVYSNYMDYLTHCDDDSFDVVYFDPMFEVPVVDSPQFKGLRGHIQEQPLSVDAFNEAKRVAKYKVIIKERPFASVFKEWPPTEWIGGKYSRIGYGVYTKEL